VTHLQALFVIGVAFSTNKLGLLKRSAAHFQANLIYPIFTQDNVIIYT